MCVVFTIDRQPLILIISFVFQEDKLAMIEKMKKQSLDLDQVKVSSSIKMNLS